MMKFDPFIFINLAQQNGITLTRIGRDIHVQKAPAEWIPAIKKHKSQLLKYLPEDEIKKLQTDLFDDYT